MYGINSQKDDYDGFNTFIHRMKLQYVIMANQVSNIHLMSITVLRWCQLNIWTSVTYTCNLIHTPQTTKDIRDPKYLPEFDMAVMQRSALPDQNFMWFLICSWHFTSAPYDMKFWQALQIRRGVLATLKKVRSPRDISRDIWLLVSVPGDSRRSPGCGCWRLLQEMGAWHRSISNCMGQDT